MRDRLFRIIVCAGVATWLAAVPVGLVGAADDGASRDADAIRELLEGDFGQRVSWGEAPKLLVLENVMDFTGPNMGAGYAATRDMLSDRDVDQIVDELTAALDQLTGGTVTSFADVRVERVPVGERISVFRPGYVTVGRYKDVQKRAGTLGFGGRMTRRGAIAAASIVLDANFDRKHERRRLLRTHELGHALGFNHVESRPSVMNPIVGQDVTEFDRAAIRLVFGEPPAPEPPPLPTFPILLPLLN